MRVMFYTVLARVRGFLRPGRGDADFDQEMHAHLSMAVDDKVRRGMTREDAHREARIELGGVAQLREASRAARGLPWLDTFWLDGKLGLRMLRKAWGLTLVGGLAMAITIGLGASIFTIWSAFAGTDLPLDEGDRVVAIQSFDLASQRVRNLTPADIRRWRDAGSQAGTGRERAPLNSVEQLSAMRVFAAMVITREGPTGSMSAAEMTASAFRLARVQPVIGRFLIDEDERDGAERVVVIGHDLWRSGFGADPGVIGQRVQIGDTLHTLVGVMPEGFRFPLNQRLWTPLRLEQGSSSEAEGPDSADLFVFGRLVPGATPETARAEVTTLGLLPRATDSGMREQLQMRVVPYAAGIFPDVHDNPWLGGVMFLLGALLLIPPCANIAILVFARTVTRREEFATRSALGASRGRVVMQVFIEVLVLASVAGVAGVLFAYQFAARLLQIVMPGTGPSALPFWMELTPSFPTVICAGGLSVIAAAIAGALPAFNATGRWRRSGPQALAVRGTGDRLGKTWMALLATQVTVSLAILPTALEMTWGIFRPAIVGPGLPVQDYLTASLMMEGASSSDRASRFESLTLQAVERLRSEAGISGVSMSAAVLMQEPFSDIEIEGIESSGVQARFNSIDDRFFDVFDVRFLAGRRFDARDFGAGSTSIVVNRSFVTELIGDAPALGRRVRYVDSARERASNGAQPPVAAPRWFEIIGIVEDFPESDVGPHMYQPLTTPTHPVSLVIRTPSGVGAAANRLRAVTSALDPQLRAGRLQSLEEVYWRRRSLDHTFGVVLGTVTMIALVFSLSGIYTLMTFTLAQRWREIGLRSALGAHPRRLVVGVFGRAAVPLIIGAIVGGVLAMALNSSIPVTEAGGLRIPGVVPLSAAFLILVGLLAASGPARRALRINPTDALRVT